MIMMMNTTSAATTVTAAYYQSFESETRTMTPPPAGKVTPEDQALDEARQQTYDLQFLSAGWNGYDALPPSKDAVDLALRWLVSSYAECKDAQVHWYKPNVSASAEGEVVFEWWDKNRSLIVYIDAEEATFHKSQNGDGPTEHIHGDASLGGQQAELLRWFGE
jgi:hypothetical protein